VYGSQESIRIVWPELTMMKSLTQCGKSTSVQGLLALQSGQEALTEPPEAQMVLPLTSL
jgi:hypothetical protein